MKKKECVLIRHENDVDIAPYYRIKNRGGNEDKITKLL